MKRKNILTIAGVTLAVCAAGLVAAVAPVAAQSESYNDLVQNIATKFGLNVADVQQVFTDTREQKQDEKLDALVTSGDLTADQRNKLEELKDALQAKHEELKDTELTRAEMREQLEPLHNALKDYIEQEGLQDVLPGRGGAMGGMRGGPRGEF